MNFVDRVYRGEVRLWKVFWFGYVLPKIPFMLVVKVIQEVSQLRESWIGYVIIGLLLLYQVWIGIGLFACAPNVNKRLWFWMGRVVAVMVLLSVVVSVLQPLRN